MDSRLRGNDEGQKGERLPATNRDTLAARRHIAVTDGGDLGCSRVRIGRAIARDIQGMTKKKLIIAGLLSVTAIGGIGATAHAFMGHKGPMRADTNGDGVVSRSEFFTAAETRFKAKDANNDRMLTGDEMQDKRGRFARLDTNNDGKLSFAEQAAGTNARFAKLDVDGDGKLTPEELGPRHRHGPREDGPGLAQDQDDAPMARGGGMGAGMLMRADANGDGKITREEMRAQADQRFDRLDANKDGVIDQAELQAIRDRMGQRGQGRRGMGRMGMDDMPPPPPPAAAPAAPTPPKP